MLEARNSKKQGDIGLGIAISWFTKQGYTVCIPLTDSQDYDLVIDVDGVLGRVQVKTTTYKSQYDVYSVGISVKGGNQSFNTIKTFDNTKVDYLFIVTNDSEMYFIPAADIEVKNSINLGSKYSKYKVT